ncbi:unnamed protein product [Rotaria sp. Silwood2]|nr:unnamed protein product [Rotaria sp. Silwood2]CAF4502302.1 unnamed protein product [Rotaria sp. Silwood2]
MEHLSLKLSDLPDEILVLILKKLDNIEVLYSLRGVNKQLNTIANDSIFASYLPLFVFLDDFASPLPDPILNQFCSHILLEIHHKIKWLDLESTSMERILLATDYPYLCGLGLYGFDVEKALSLFTNDTSFASVNKSQLSSLVIDIDKNNRKILPGDIGIIIFTHIFTMFTNLKYLNFGPSSKDYQRLSFRMSPPTCFSSSLLELHVRVDLFSDCLYLLDGRFNQLHTFDIHIVCIFSNDLIINTEKLCKLRCFSLRSDMRTHYYGNLILPLLHRMLNLEKLYLQLEIDSYKEFIDGNDLKENIINYMSQLNKFTFNIRVVKHSPNIMNLPSNEYIQHTFKDFKDNQIISCIDYFQKRGYSYCHIYSYPYRMHYYFNITNNFPGGLFEYVRRVSLYDEHPFEYEFFLQIAQSFPFMKDLSVINDKPQRNKLSRKSKKINNQNLSIIKYPYLINLNLFKAHDDYIEQFLVDTDMYLSNNTDLAVHYEALKRVTENFTRHATRINCAKLYHVHLYGAYEITKHLADYLPHAIISCLL